LYDGWYWNVRGKLTKELLKQRGETERVEFFEIWRQPIIIIIIVFLRTVTSRPMTNPSRTWCYVININYTSYTRRETRRSLYNIIVSLSTRRCRATTRVVIVNYFHFSASQLFADTTSPGVYIYYIYLYINHEFATTELIIMIHLANDFKGNEFAYASNRYNERLWCNTSTLVPFCHYTILLLLLLLL